MIETLAILSLIVVIGITIAILKKSKTNEDLLHTKNLQDELLYDPKTGTKYSLEDAESGEIKNSNPNWIKSQEEIETNYSEEEIEVEYARNYLRKKGYKVVDQKDEVLNAILTELNQHYQEIEIDSIFKINQSSYLYFISPTYSVQGHKGSVNTYTELQLLLWIKEPSQNQLTHLNSLKDTDHFQLKEGHYFKLNKIATKEGVMDLLDEA